MHALQLCQLVAEGVDLGAKLRVVGVKSLVLGSQAKIVLVSLLTRMAFVVEKRADARAFGAERTGLVQRLAVSAEQRGNALLQRCEARQQVFRRPLVFLQCGTESSEIVDVRDSIAQRLFGGRA